jgi:hypothetical protein
MLHQRAIKILSLLAPSPIAEALPKRFGSPHDGGYVICDDLNNSDFMISMGVGSDVTFEKSVAKKVAGVHLYDHTVDSLPEVDDKFVFYREKVDANDGISLQETISRAPNQSPSILKMDIEGSEWRLLNESTDLLLNFRQIVLEVHNLMKIDLDEDFHLFESVLERLHNSFYLFNAHPNNNGNSLIVGNLLLPDVVELTFLNKSKYSIAHQEQQQIKYQVEILNRPCDPHSPELFLQRIIHWDKMFVANNERGWPNTSHQIGSRWYPPQSG